MNIAPRFKAGPGSLRSFEVQSDDTSARLAPGLELGGQHRDNVEGAGDGGPRERVR